MWRTEGDSGVQRKKGRLVGGVMCGFDESRWIPQRHNLLYKSYKCHTSTKNDQNQIMFNFTLE